MSKALRTVGARRISRRGLFTMAGAALAPAALTACDDKTVERAFPLHDVRLMVPAEEGGGWDMTARSMQEAILGAKVIDKDVQVYNIAGDAGINALQELVSNYHSDPHELMVMGVVMMGGVVVNESSVNLTQVTPIATLTSEDEILVVSASSPYSTLDDVITQIKSDSSSVVWGGGSLGGIDQILVGDILKHADLDPTLADEMYEANSGGAGSIDDLISGNVSVAVSGISEYAELLQSGELRGLAVSGAEPLEIAGVTVPTLKQEGYDIELTNWRGVVAPPGIADHDYKSLNKIIDDLHKSPEWKKVLEDKGWSDFYRTGDDLKKFFATEADRVAESLRDLELA
ncbi:MAG TPA: hypothetical protein H9902_14165 [Candidatus Stackebrandtia faecavium]|nr:hypothetical protein [Candidatus Stackebrandtia faecavium]